jgi:hypothetical protein
MVFGSPDEEEARVRLPGSVLVALGISAIPVFLLGGYVPGILEEMLRLAAASLGR